jgi:hypothetical protein|tara:strand:+ start:84 stop:689 length:606 start_codon:yes stop_codon:yes gene_type:complete
MANTVKATRLAAVNTIISNIGQAPVTNLESGNPLVEMAEQILDEVTRAVLAEGWEFNTERHYPFTPNSTNEIVIPDNVLTLDTKSGSAKQTIIRNGKLYDRVKHSYTFSESVDLDVTWLFDFAELPEAFKNYITIRAANVFAGRSVGSQEAVTFGQREETIARATLLEYDTQQGDYTMFQDYEGGSEYSRSAYLPVNVFNR